MMERRGVVDHSHVECALSRQLVLWPTRSGLHVAARQLRHSRFDSRNSRFNGLLRTLLSILRLILTDSRILLSTHPPHSLGRILPYLRPAIILCGLLCHWHRHRRRGRRRPLFRGYRRLILATSDWRRIMRTCIRCSQSRGNVGEVFCYERCPWGVMSIISRHESRLIQGTLIESVEISLGGRLFVAFDTTQTGLRLIIILRWRRQRWTWLLCIRNRR